MLKYLFILYFSVIHKSIINSDRASRATALISYSLSFLIITFFLAILMLFQLENIFDDLFKLGVLLVGVLFMILFLSPYFILECYYLKSKRYIEYVDLYETYSTEKKIRLKIFGIVIMLGIVAFFIYTGIAFSHYNDLIYR